MKHYLSFDGSMHSTGFALFKCEDGKEPEVKMTKTITVSKKLKAEDAVIQMIEELLAVVTTFCEYESFDLDGVICEIQKPHGTKEVMSMQAFAHLAAVPLAVLGYAKHKSLEYYMYTPVEWKGTTKKEVMTKRLYANEVVALTDPKLFSLKQHDILDAIGLGRYHFEQMEYLRRTGRGK